MPSHPIAHEHFAELIESAAAVASQPELRDVLNTTIDRGMELTGARFGALGVLGPDGRLADFYHVGLDPETVQKIGHYPEGRGILGLITEGKTIRVDRIEDHPSAAGFPEHHPRMTTFLGVPIRIAEEVFGNLYLTDKEDGFTASDQALVESLAVIAASAITNARLHDRLLRAALVEDRARIARDLHDAIIQELYAVGLSLQGLTKKVSESAARADLEMAVDRLDESIGALRRFIFDLGPPVWADRRLDRELRHVVSEMSLAYSAAVDVSLDGPFDDLGGATTDTAVLVVREALSNALRHARADRIELEATMDSDGLLVVVSDDGTGFDVGTVGRGLGLDNITQRVRQRGGRVDIESEPGAGTRVIIRLPR